MEKFEATLKREGEVFKTLAFFNVLQLELNRSMDGFIAAKPPQYVEITDTATKEEEVKAKEEGKAEEEEG